MTVQNVPPEKRYAANGVSPSYTIPFLLIEAGDLDVYLNGVEVTSGFTITGVGNPTSTITFTPPYPLGDLYLFLDVPFQRLVDYQLNGDFLSTTVNRDFDRIWQALKQLMRTTSRSPVLGFNDIDGEGNYLAKGNGITGLASANGVPDAAANWLDVLTYVASILETGQGPINNSANVVYLFPNMVARTVQDLSNFLDAAKGSKGIGHYNPAGVPLTVSDVINSARNIRMFGTLANNGVTNDLATFVALSQAGPGVYDLRGLNCMVDGQVTIGAGQIWLTAGSTFNLGTNDATTLFMSQSHDAAIVGPLKLQGRGKAAGTAKGLQINDSKRFLVVDVTAFDVPGWGFYMSGNTTVQRYEGGRLVRIGGHRCYKGYEDVPGHEYISIDSPHFTKNTIFGMKQTAGNVQIVEPKCMDNDLDGFLLFGGSNHAHGNITGGNFNHNAQYNFYASDVTNGHTITGAHFYGNNNMGSGAIFLERSGGVVFNGGHLDCKVYDYNSTGQNVIRNMHCPGSYGPIVPAGPGGIIPPRLWFDNNTGPGIINGFKSINEPQSLNTIVRRRGTLQAVTVNVGTQIFCNTAIRDNHVAYNLANGNFVVPVGQDGLYSIKASLIFTAPGYSTTNSYVELRIDNQPYKLGTSTSYGTGILGYEISYEVDLVAGNVINFNAFIAATTASFGHTTYDSQVIIKRIA